MANSSLKNSVHRRVHLERTTPKDKTKLGPQERNRHFKKRAKAIKNKKKILESLQNKSANANPNEFRFAMLSSKLINNKFVKLDKDENVNNQIISNIKKIKKIKKKKFFLDN